MSMFNLLKIRTSIGIFKNEKCKVTFGLEYISTCKYNLIRNNSGRNDVVSFFRHTSHCLEFNSIYCMDKQSLLSKGKSSLVIKCHTRNVIKKKKKKKKN